MSFLAIAMFIFVTLYKKTMCFGSALTNAQMILQCVCAWSALAGSIWAYRQALPSEDQRHMTMRHERLLSHEDWTPSGSRVARTKPEAQTLAWAIVA